MFPVGIKSLARRLGLGVLLLPAVIVLVYALHRGYRTLPVLVVAMSAIALVLFPGALMMAVVNHIGRRTG